MFFVPIIGFIVSSSYVGWKCKGYHDYYRFLKSGYGPKSRLRLLEGTLESKSKVNCKFEVKDNKILPDKVITDNYRILQNVTIYRGKIKGLKYLSL